MILPAALTSLLIIILNTWHNDHNQHDVSTSQHRKPLNFQLRHLHATSPESHHTVFSDIPPQHLVIQLESGDNNVSHTYTIKRTVPLKTYRPPSFQSVQNARLWSRKKGESLILDWDEETIEGPDVNSRETLLELAKMTNNAYLSPGDDGWYELGKGWKSSYPFGWEPDADGFRGHVFATPDNSTVVVSIKGTSAGVFGGGGPTSKKDKLNDNLLFSCCCAKIDWTWSPVCGCHRGGYKCDQNCLEEALADDSLFYPIGMNLYNNLTYMYPESNIWVIGHSLGGALASLVGTTFGAPVVTFESPGDRMAAKRLHLPSPPSTQHVTHVYHTADPIAMGTCNGILSSCALGGYAMESRCHLGKTIVYDTVSTINWTADVRTHGIVTVIEKLLGEPWRPSSEVGKEVPEPVVQDDCFECYSWDFGDYPKT